MSAVAAGAELPVPARSLWSLVWVTAIGAAFALYVASDLAPWAVEYPKGAVVPVVQLVNVIMAWMVENLSIVTRAISRVIEAPLDLTLGLFAKNFTIGDGESAVVIPRLSWVGIVGAVAIAGYAYGGYSLALIAGGCFLYIALFGQWESAMLTLASVAICVPAGVASGLAVGIWGHRSPTVNRLLIVPILDLMQTVPAFAYLVPVLLLFGFGPVAALIATVIFAMPPMVRTTTLALSQVPAEINDFGAMVGCTRRQKLWRVQIPSARPLLMVGVNQVIMLTLNMVIIASMIGAGGLGYDVLLALRALKIGDGLEAGLAIVVVAIALDRLSQAAATRPPTRHPPGTPLWVRHPYLLASVAFLAVTTAVSTLVPALEKVPEAITITTAPMWGAMVAWLNINFFDAIEAVRVALLLNVLNPFKAFLLAVPWVAVAAMATLAGLHLGGRRLALLSLALILFPAVTGLWEKTMITVYLCGISSLFAALIGIPLGVLAARHEAARRVLTATIDTLQTLPSFVYLIPVVMLFRVGDVTALIAIVLFAVAPAIRYTEHGIRGVPPEIIEAAMVSGCTRRQLLWRVQIPLALPEIMLGINQTILLALSMLVITALVGTRDLGQEVFISLAKADPGRGIVAGLIVAFIGILADRLIGAWCLKARRRLNLA